MRRFHIVLVLIATILKRELIQVLSFTNVTPILLYSPIGRRHYSSSIKRNRREIILRSASSSTADAIAQQLKQTIIDSKEDEAGEVTKDKIAALTSQLEDEFSSRTSSSEDPFDTSRFDPLIGLYEVSHVQTARDGDNPVGGKWTRKNKLTSNLFKLRRTFQHILPIHSTGIIKRANDDKIEVVAECVNVVSLEFLKFLRLMVVLRGDALSLTPKQRNSKDMVKPLSDLAVKVLFDPPYIGIGRGEKMWCNIQLGPSTDVILDTTHVGNAVRLGMGGISGSKFVFSRCQDNDMEANEFRDLLKMKPVRRRILLGVLGTLISVGGFSFSRGQRIFGGMLSLFTSFVGIAVLTSTGGVETNRQMSSPA